MRSPRALATVLAVAAFAGGVELGAEAPTRADLERSLLLMRNHLLPTSRLNGFDGLWLLDVERSRYQRLRPFTMSRTPPGQIGSYSVGEHSYLVIDGDRVIVQAYPYDVHFDGLNWRMLNRLPAAGGHPTGWAVQGPLLNEGAVAGTGLAPGIHGIARCGLRIITASHWGSVSCQLVTLPGGELPTQATEDRLLLFTSVSPGDLAEASWLHTFDEGSLYRDRVLLSYDPGRRGFWRGAEVDARFFPVVDGRLLEPTLTLNLDAFPFGDTDDVRFLDALHYHPGRDRLYAVLHLQEVIAPAPSSLLVEVDPETGEAVSLGDVVDESFPPFTLASFGPAPERHEQIVPVVADAPGRHGSRWRTDLWLYNPASTPATVALSRLRRPELAEELVLAPHASVHLPDVLLGLGGGAAGDGLEHDALKVVSTSAWAEQVVAFARIWTRDPASGGAYGHAVPSVPAPYGYSNHSVLDPIGAETGVDRFNVGANALAAYLDLDLREPGRFRHNLGIVNPSDEEVTIDLLWTFVDSLRNQWPNEAPRRASIRVPPGDLRLVSLERLFPTEVVEGWVPRIGVFGATPAILWLSMVDNLTGDSTFVPYSLFSATSALLAWPEVHNRPVPDYRLAIPMVAHNPGVGGSSWQTDLFASPDMYYQSLGPFVAYHPSDAGSCQTIAGRPEIAAYVEGELAMPLERWAETLGISVEEIEYRGIDRPLRTLFPDIVRGFPECAGTTSSQGGLEVLAGSWFAGFSRTYTTRPDGGTYGGMLPLYPPGGMPVQHFAGLQVSADSRVNLGFFNGNHDRAVTSRVTLYDAEGRKVAERTLTLASLASRQRELLRFFDLDALPEGTYGLTVLPLDDPETGAQGRSWAYVSVVDNRTHDPVNIW